MDFFFATSNLPFTIALGMVVALGLLELASSMVGMGVGGMIDALLPDLDVEADLDVDLDPGVDAPTDLDHANAVTPELDGPIWRLLAWLQVGRVPVIVLLLILLTTFGVVGLLTQHFMQRWLGFLLPGLLLSAPVLLLTLPVVRSCGKVLAMILPKDETSAVSERTFIGRVAQITLGEARRGKPAQARLRDQHGQTHYVMLEPDADDQVLEQGAHVLLISRHGGTFRGIRNTNDALIDPPPSGEGR